MDDATWELIMNSLGPLFWGAVRGTIPLALLSFAAGLVIALVVALARISRHRLIAGVATLYVSVIRGTPLLVQLYLIFYALPSLGIVIPAFPSAVVAFSLNVGGYAAETIRAAIISVPQGQWEAAATVGLSRWVTLRRVILPQALRVAVPPLSNTFISLVKDTSLASSIMVTELLRKAQEIAAPTFQFLLLYALAALYYWIICSVLSVIQGRLEKRLSPATTEAATEQPALTAAS